MNRAYLLTGGNMGMRAVNLQIAKDNVGLLVGKVLAESQLYETAAWGFSEQPAFLNQVLLIETSLTVTQLLETLLQIEQTMGRIRQQQNGPRIIDIDILFFNNEVINLPALTVPHPRLHLRKFTLIPLSEIAPQLVHPVLKQNMAQLLANCPDTLNVQKYCLTSE